MYKGILPYRVHKGLFLSRHGLSKRSQAIGTSRKFVIAPTYAPLLVALKHYDTFKKGTFDLIRAGYQALLKLLSESPPMYLVLSLADFKTTIPLLRVYVSNLLSSARQHNIQALIDCGSLEKLYASDKYFVDKVCFEDPLTNLKEQLSLHPVPNVVTLLDNTQVPETFASLEKREFTKVLRHARLNGIRVLLVMHNKDIEAVDLMKQSELTRNIDYVAVPERELKANEYILSRLRTLKKDLMIFGIDDFSLTLSNHIKYGVFMGDSTAWLTSRFFFNCEGVPRIREAKMREIAHIHSKELADRLYENLLALQRIERIIRKGAQFQAEA